MTGTLAGKRILVVEDEYFIASDLRKALDAQGAQVVGPVANLNAGLELAELAVDAAVLDVNLEEDRSFPIADRLQSRSIPFLFLTGYDCWALPDQYQQAARLAKPFAPSSVVAMLEELLVGQKETI
jgi:DNA-binding response OmpR family regulator